MTSRGRGGQQIPNRDRAILRIDFAEDFAHQRDWLACEI